jgi:hypothetical protein
MPMNDVIAGILNGNGLLTGYGNPAGVLLRYPRRRSRNKPSASLSMR